MRVKTLNTALQTLLAEAETLQAAMDAKSENGKTAYDGLAADRERLVKMSADATELKKQIEAAQALEGAKSFAGVEVKTEPAGAAYVERRTDGGNLDIFDEGPGGLDQKTRAAISTTSYKRAFQKYLRTPWGFEGLGPDDRKTLQEGVDASGGFLVPEEWVNRMVEKKPAPTNVAGLVMQINTSREAIVMPKVNYSTDDIYTTGVRVTKTGEVPSSSTVHRVTDPAFGQVRIPVHTYMLSMPLTNDMIEDSAFPIMSWASGKFSETIDLLKDNEILNGTAIGGPEGLLLNAGGTGGVSAVVTGSASTFTADGLIDLDYSVPPQYLQNLRYIMSRVNSAKVIAKLKDSQNRYLFSMGGASDGGLQGNRPDTLLGKPVVYSEFMPSPASNAFPVLFGDFTGYYLVNRVGFSIQVLRELYAETNQQVLIGRLRFGGQPVETWKMKAHKCST